MKMPKKPKKHLCSKNEQILKIQSLRMCSSFQVKAGINNGRIIYFTKFHPQITNGLYVVYIHLMHFKFNSNPYRVFLVVSAVQIWNEKSKYLVNFN